MRGALAIMAVCLLKASTLTSCARRPALNVVIVGGEEDRFTRQIGGARIVIGCDPLLTDEVELLFAHLRELSRRGIELVDGVEVPYGWTTFSLQLVRGRLEVWEPDYERETESRGRPEISASLKIDAAQRSFLSKIAVESSEVQYDQHMLVSSDAWSSDQVMLFRVASPGGRMSGWRMVNPHAESDAGTIESVPIYEVYRRRPELLSSLTLPPGYLVFYRSGAPHMVMDSSDQVIWKDGVRASPASAVTRGGAEFSTRGQTALGAPK